MSSLVDGGGVITFMDPLLNMTLMRIKEQYDRRKNPDDIHIEPGLAKRVVEAYEYERGSSEAQLYELAMDVARDQWGDVQPRITLCVEAKCDNPHHDGIKPYRRPLNEKLLDMVRKTDYELAWSHRKKCPEVGCKRMMVPTISYFEFEPVPAKDSELRYISTRIKGDDRLVGKIADGVAGINYLVRPGSLHPRWDPADLNGIMFRVVSKEGCYGLFRYFEERGDVTIPEPRNESINDYFEKPKIIPEIASDGIEKAVQSPYHAIHANFKYGNMYGEAQFIRLADFNDKRLKRGIASHGRFAERQEEARRQEWRTWAPVFEKVSNILGLQE